MPLSLGEIEDERVYTPKQIAEALQAKPKLIAKAFRDGELAGVELGPRTIRVTGRAVKEWLTSKKSRTNLGSSGEQAENSLADSGASTSKSRARSVKDMVLASL